MINELVFLTGKAKTSRKGWYIKTKVNGKTRYRKYKPKERKEIRKLKKISLKKGITSARVDDIQKVSNTEIKRINKLLISPLLSDKKDLDKMIKQENMKKLSSRISAQLTFIGTKGQVIHETSVFNITPESLMRKAQNAKFKGRFVKEGSDDATNKILAQIDANFGDTKESGHIEKVKATFKLRKG